MSDVAKKVFDDGFDKLVKRAKKDGNFTRLKGIMKKKGDRVHLRTLKKFISNSVNNNAFTDWKEQVYYLRDNWPKKMFETEVSNNLRGFFQEKEDFDIYENFLEELESSGFSKLFKKEKRKFIGYLKKVDLYDVKFLPRLNIGNKRLLKIFQERQKRGLDLDPRYIEKSFPYEIRDAYVKGIIADGSIFSDNSSWNSRDIGIRLDYITMVGLKVEDYIDQIALSVFNAYGYQKKRKEDFYDTIKFKYFSFPVDRLSSILIGLFKLGVSNGVVMKILNRGEVKKKLARNMRGYFLEVKNHKLLLWWIKEYPEDFTFEDVWYIDNLVEKHGWCKNIRKQIVDLMMINTASMKSWELLEKKNNIDLNRKLFVVSWRSQLKKSKSRFPRKYGFFKRLFDAYGKKPSTGFYTSLIEEIIDSRYSEIEEVENLFNERDTELSREEEDNYLNFVYSKI